jgi:hypothetical protein
MFRRNRVIPVPIDGQEGAPYNGGKVKGYRSRWRKPAVQAPRRSGEAGNSGSRRPDSTSRYPREACSAATRSANYTSSPGRKLMAAGRCSGGDRGWRSTRCSLEARRPSR